MFLPFPSPDLIRLDEWILFLAYCVGLIMGVFAFAHALSQRADAYTAAERLTKPAWLGITGGGAFALLLFSLSGPGGMFWLAGLVAVTVYLVDVRPRLIEVQRGPRW
ncbi:DUF2516 family protein [Saccharothrix algeriensis]|uniref:DUF2516 family protein n=1 Tax=Saccharothrix algeriensis TaxID=173560 RepID=A0A8T8HS55_9PSEU|nr:hypothetical protein [Saccharothrix algeriensis]QTR01257.1 DUF2516 family protein [Saccharothrix algeriensis]